VYCKASHRDELKAGYSRSSVEESLGRLLKAGMKIVSRPEIEANDLVEGSPFLSQLFSRSSRRSKSKNYLGSRSEKVKLFVTDDQVDEALRRLQESQCAAGAR